MLFFKVYAKMLTMKDNNDLEVLVIDRFVRRHTFTNTFSFTNVHAYCVKHV